MFSLASDGGVVIDHDNANTDGMTPGLKFGYGSGEGITSKRSWAGGGSGYGLDFYTSFQPRLSIANNGDVGIGTTTPASRFHVQGSGDTEISIQSSDAAGRRWTLQSSGDNPGQGRFEIIDRTSFVSRLAILPDGNVGIGTTSPQSALDVAGTGRMGELDIANTWGHLAFNAHWDPGISAWKRIADGPTSVLQHDGTAGGFYWLVAASSHHPLHRGRQRGRLVRQRYTRLPGLELRLLQPRDRSRSYLCKREVHAVSTRRKWVLALRFLERLRLGLVSW